LETTAGVGVGEETALEADIDTDIDEFGGVAGFTDPDTDAIGLADADIDEFGGVAGFTDPDTDAIGLPVFASQHLDSVHLPAVHLTSFATTCIVAGHSVNDEQ
jgi:hypothetical protein